MIPGVKAEDTPDLADMDRAINVLGCYVAGAEAQRAETDIASVQKVLTGLLTPIRFMYAQAMADTSGIQERTATGREPTQLEGADAVASPGRDRPPTEPPE